MTSSRDEAKRLLNKLLTTEEDVNKFVSRYIPDMGKQVLEAKSKLEKIDIISSRIEPAHIIRDLFDQKPSETLNLLSDARRHLSLITFSLVTIVIFVLIISIFLLFKKKQISEVEKQLTETQKQLADSQKINFISENRIRFIVSYAKVSPSKEKTERGLYRVENYSTGYMQAPQGVIARYVDSIKSNAPINKNSLVGYPKITILNEDFYKQEPNKLDFSVENVQASSELQGSIKSTFLKKLSQQEGFIGFHVPYRTDFLIFFIDTSEIGFVFEKDTPPLRPSIAAIDPRGASRIDLGLPEFHTFFSEDGKQIFVLTARNLAADSSIILRWGPN